MAAQLADQQDDETSEIVLRAACADGGLDRLLLQLRMRCHPSRTALISYAESYLRAPTRADVLWRLRHWAWSPGAVVLTSPRRLQPEPPQKTRARRA